VEFDGLSLAALRKLPLARLGSALRRFGIVIAFALLVVILSLLSGSFLTVSNLLNIARQVSINAVIAAGMTFVILTGGIDLSVGSVLAVSGAVIAGLLSAGRPLLVGIGAGLAVGAALGLLDGLVITRGKVQPFIATLGMLTIGRGLTLVYTDGRPITGLPDAFVWLGAGEVSRIPVPVVIMILVSLISYGILTQTVFGRYVYAIGGNEEAARLSGVDVATHKTLVYVISGVHPDRPLELRAADRRGRIRAGRHRGRGAGRHDAGRRGRHHQWNVAGRFHHRRHQQRAEPAECESVLPAGGQGGRHSSGRAP